PLERAVRRAGLPFAVSQGFSPHMKIAFGAALPVGVGGTHELFDGQLTRYVPADEALEALQAARRCPWGWAARTSCSTCS
ncbi:TIGR03936 family radical SAM-associated protein, partial [Eggerthella sinensis]|uniref:TIGR03936 family radical SAM-associated protein n=1 Tax=Eggerthella sinensis TaxID=242230 RepID=UPI0022E5DBF1